MKIALLLLALFLVLGGLLGTLMARDPGYVLIAYDDKAVETSLWFALAVLVLAYLLVRWLIWLGLRLFRGGTLLSGYRDRRRIQSARARTNRGLLLLAEGQWPDAKKQLLAGARGMPEPLVNYLSAARAANALGELEERDALLKQAHETTPGSYFAVGVTHADLQFESGQTEQCIATLRSLLEHAPRHPLLLRRLVDCYRRVGDWSALAELLPVLRKARTFDSAHYSELSDAIWLGLLTRSADPEAREKIWQSLPRNERRRPALVAAYADTAIAQETPDAAAAALRDALNHVWEPDLLHRYGALRGGAAAERLRVAEGWLKKRPNDPALALCLGRLALQNGQWEAARAYFETGARIAPGPELNGELGRLLAALGEPERAAGYLTGPIPELPDMPLPGGAVEILTDTE